MKRIFLSALIGAGIVAAIFQIFSGSEAARPQESYPLVCRGGPTLTIYIAPGVTNIGFTFTQAPGPATEGLLPGQCSWNDRRMSPSEPVRVSQHLEEGTAVPGAPRFPETLKVFLAPENKWYEELHSTEKYWTFMVYNNGLGLLIATSARPNGTVDGSTAKKTDFTPTPQGAKTWQWYTHWSNFTDFSGAIDTEPYVSPGAGQITAGFLHHWDGGHGPFPNQERTTVEFVGTVWFDLSEIFSKPPLPKAESAMLTFKAITSDGPGGKCKDELRLPGDDWMKGLPENTLPKTGSLEPPVYFTGCPAAGCSFDVTSIVNNWITGREDRYGFAISGLDDIAAIGAEDGKYPDNNAHCTTRYSDFRLTVTYKDKDSEPPVVIPPTDTPVRKNVALTANGGTASASSNTALFLPAKAIDGEHQGLNWLSGGGWQGAGPTNDDWLQVDFGDFKMIDEIDVFMIQDDYASPKEPSLDMLFTKYGLTNFRVQYWTKFGSWSDVPPGEPVINNMNVWKQFKFSSRRTNKIRVLVSKTPDGWSRIAELEAWGY